MAPGSDHRRDFRLVCRWYQHQKPDIKVATTYLVTLTEREKKVLRLRFGIGDGYPRTLEEVGAIFSVTRERVRQIQGAALKKLKKALSSKPSLLEALPERNT